MGIDLFQASNKHISFQIVLNVMKGINRVMWFRLIGWEWSCLGKSNKRCGSNIWAEAWMMRLSFPWKKPQEEYLSQREKRKKSTETRIRKTDGGKERPLVYVDCNDQNWEGIEMRLGSLGMIGLDRNLEAFYLRFWDGDLREGKSQGSYLVTLVLASLRQWKRRTGQH